jgi:hypothetical protein
MRFATFLAIRLHNEVLLELSDRPIYNLGTVQFLFGKNLGIKKVGIEFEECDGKYWMDIVVSYPYQRWSDGNEVDVEFTIANAVPTRNVSDAVRIAMMNLSDYDFIHGIVKCMLLNVMSEAGAPGAGVSDLPGATERFLKKRLGVDLTLNAKYDETENLTNCAAICSDTILSTGTCLGRNEAGAKFDAIANLLMNIYEEVALYHESPVEL